MATPRALQRSTATAIMPHLTEVMIMHRMRIVIMHPGTAIVIMKAT